MKKTSYKDILIHSLELKIFIIELEKMLSKFSISTYPRVMNQTSDEKGFEEQRETS